MASSSFPVRLGLASTLFFAATSAAQSNSALIAEQIDKQIPSLQLDGVLPAVMEQISQATSVRIDASPAVWDLLPWGKQTNVTTKIQNRTLGETLTAITRRLGLTWTLRDNAIELEPLPALTRLGRRATLPELLLLNELSSTPLKLDSGLRATLRQVVEAIDAQLAANKSDYVIENRAPQPPASSVQETIIPIKRMATLADALESISVATNVTWYPWGKSVVVLTKEDVTRALLQKPITVRYDGMDVGQALLELARLTKVSFQIEPGAVQRIPPEYRSIRLIVDSASVQQVLEQLSATTGVGYVVTDKGVYIWNNSPIPNVGGAAASSNAGGPGRVSLLIPTPSGQLVLPESEMPEDVRAYMKFKRDKAIEQMREQMKKDGFTPPATRPQREDL